MLLSQKITLARFGVPIFIQRYTSYLLIFLWTDTKLRVNLKLREKFTRWKKTREFHDNESEYISAESELLCHVPIKLTHLLKNFLEAEAGNKLCAQVTGNEREKLGLLCRQVHGLDIRAA